MAYIASPIKYATDCKEILNCIDNVAFGIRQSSIYVTRGRVKTPTRILLVSILLLIGHDCLDEC